MRQFELHPNPSERSREIAPFLIVLQSHLLAAAPTTVVAPLIHYDPRAAYTDLSVRVEFQGQDYLISIAELAAIDARKLRQAVGDPADHEDAIRRALERLFTGF